MDERSLRRFRLFYLYYPQLAMPIRGSLSPVFKEIDKVGTMTPLLPNLPKMGTASPQSQESLFVPGDKILAKLSYSMKLYEAKNIITEVFENLLTRKNSTISSATF